MGACASRQSDKRTEPSSPVEDAGVNMGIMPLSRRHMMTASDDNGKRSTADKITSAFLAQAGVVSEPTQGIAARLASRRGAEDRRASAQAAHLGLGPAPAAESRADLADGGPAASIAKEALPQCASPAPVCPADDSFEVSRAETVERLVSLQKSFKGSSGPSPVWAFTDSQKFRDAGKAIAHRVGGQEDCRSSKPSGGGAAGAGRSGCGGGGGAEDGDGDVSGPQPGAEEVVPVGEEVGAGPETTAPKSAMVCATAVEGAAKAGAGAADEMMRPGTTTAAGLEGSRRGEACATPRRDEEPGTCFRTVSVARMQSISKTAAAASATPAGDGAAGAAAAEAGGGDGDAGALAAATTDVQAETDELTSLPLPNLINPRTDTTRVAKLAPRAGQRFSAAAYLQQAPLEPRLSAAGGAATRNSDLGYYLEEARYTEAAPLQGAQPVRHNLLDSPMVRQRAAQAAKEAEAAAAARAPVVLDYVPSIKLQSSRVNLLAQPSQKRTLLPGGRGGVGGGGAVLPLGEDDDDGDSGAAASRRLEYTPNRTISRKFSHANLHSGSILLCAGGSSRPMSPVNSRPSLLAVADLFPSSPRVTGTDSGERCFHVTRAGAAAVAAASSANAVPAAAATSGGLPSALSVGALPSAVSTSALPTAAASPLGPTRRREVRRESSSASQVHFGPVAMLKTPATPSTPSTPQQRSIPSQDQSRRSQRAVMPTPEPRPSASLMLFASQPTSRLHMHSSGGAAACGRRSALHEVLGSAAWTGPGDAADTPPLAGALSVSGVARGSVSLDASWNDGGEGGGGGRVAAGPASAAGYGFGSASRTAGRAARLLESLQRMTTVAPEVAPVQ